MPNVHVTWNNQETWGVYLRRAAGALLVSLAFVAFVYFYVRAREVYRLQIEYAALRVEYAELLKLHEAQIEELVKRSDLTEKELYGDVRAKLAARPGPNRIELWQRNRDKQFSERINSLERRLMSLERRVEK